jgi:hypothetical protein
MRYERPGVEERKRVIIVRTIIQPVEKQFKEFKGLWVNHTNRRKP